MAAPQTGEAGAISGWLSQPQHGGVWHCWSHHAEVPPPRWLLSPQGPVGAPRKVLASPVSSAEGFLGTVMLWDEEQGDMAAPQARVRPKMRFFPSHILWGVEIKPASITGQIPLPDANLDPSCDPQANINLSQRQQQK